MTKPFQPVREDGRPYWQVIYDDVLARIERGDLKVGDIIKHAELSTLLDGIPHHQPTTRAAQHLREHHGRSLMSVRGIGYKLVAGMDHASQATTQQRRSQRSLVRAKAYAGTVDHKLLSPEESKQVTQLSVALGWLAQYTKLTADKVAEHAHEIELLKTAKMESSARQQATDDEMVAIRRRLDELEQQQKAS